MNITIQKIHVYEYAALLTGRIGVASEQWASVAITEDHYPVLDAYLSAAVENAEAELRHKLSGSHSFDLKVTEDTVVIELKEPVNVALKNLISTGLKLYMAFYVTAFWLQSTPANTLYDSYLAAAGGHLMNASRALNQPSGLTIGESHYQPRKKDNVLMRPMMPGSREVLTTTDADGGHSLGIAADRSILTTQKP